MDANTTKQNTERIKMKIKIEFDTEKKIGDAKRFSVRPIFEDSEMEEIEKLGKKLKMSTADILAVAVRLVYMTFDNVIGRNERLGFKELIETTEKQVEWEREQEKKNESK